MLWGQPKHETSVWQECANINVTRMTDRALSEDTLVAVLKSNLIRSRARQLPFTKKHSHFMCVPLNWNDTETENPPRQRQNTKRHHQNSSVRHIVGSRIGDQSHKNNSKETKNMTILCDFSWAGGDLNKFATSRDRYAVPINQKLLLTDKAEIVCRNYESHTVAQKSPSFLRDFLREGGGGFHTAVRGTIVHNGALTPGPSRECDITFFC